MTPLEFATRVRVTRCDPTGRATRAARMVLVDGIGQRAAARETGVDPAAVWRAVHKLSATHCPACGHQLEAGK
jgi:hypothetical protein